MIPEKFTPFKRVILTSPWEDFKLDRSYLKDVVINFFGFIPFGFFFLALLWNPIKLKKFRMSILVILSGGGLSLIIELIQSNFPTRSSSFTDLIFNTLGTVVGIIIFNIISGQIGNLNQPISLR